MNGGGDALYAPSCGFLPSKTQKTFRQPKLEDSKLFPTFGCGCTCEKEFQKLSFTPSQRTFGIPSTKTVLIFFFDKKNFLQTLIEIIFRYHKILQTM